MHIFCRKYPSYVSIGFNLTKKRITCRKRQSIHACCFDYKLIRKQITMYTLKTYSDFIFDFGALSLTLHHKNERNSIREAKSIS